MSDKAPDTPDRPSKGSRDDDDSNREEHQVSPGSRVTGGRPKSVRDDGWTDYEYDVANHWTPELLAKSVPVKVTGEALLRNVFPRNVIEIKRYVDDKGEEMVLWVSEEGAFVAIWKFYELLLAIHHHEPFPEGFHYVRPKDWKYEDPTFPSTFVELATGHRQAPRYVKGRCTATEFIMHRMGHYGSRSGSFFPSRLTLPPSDSSAASSAGSNVILRENEFDFSDIHRDGAAEDPIHRVVGLLNPAGSALNFGVPPDATRVTPEVGSDKLEEIKG